MRVSGGPQLVGIVSVIVAFGLAQVSSQVLESLDS